MWVLQRRADGLSVLAQPQARSYVLEHVRHRGERVRVYDIELCPHLSPLWKTRMGMPVRVLAVDNVQVGVGTSSTLAGVTWYTPGCQCGADSQAVER